MLQDVAWLSKMTSTDTDRYTTSTSHVMTRCVTLRFDKSRLPAISIKSKKTPMPVIESFIPPESPSHRSDPGLPSHKDVPVGDGQATAAGLCATLAREYARPLPPYKALVIVMEYCDSGTLSDVISSGAFRKRVAAQSGRCCGGREGGGGKFPRQWRPLSGQCCSHNAFRYTLA